MKKGLNRIVWIFLSLGSVGMVLGIFARGLKKTDPVSSPFWQIELVTQCTIGSEVRVGSKELGSEVILTSKTTSVW